VRICFVAPQAYPLLSGRLDIELVGGAELQQVLIARALAARGVDVSMVCCDFGQEREVAIDGIRVLRAYAPDAGVPVVRFVWPRLTSIWQGMRRADAEVYYQRAAGMLTGVVAEFCRQHGRKSVFAAAGNPDMTRNTPRIRYARDRWIYEYGLRHVDQIVVQNDMQAELCRANFGRQPVKLLSVYEKPGIPGPIDRGTCVLWVSTIRGLKQPQRFLDLAARLPQVAFRMIGGPGYGESGLFRSVRDRARSLPNVEFMGFLPLEQTEAHFETARVFVNTSESEGFPNTFLQAWSRGIPTVSFIDAGARLDGKPIGAVVNGLEELVEVVATLVKDDVAARAEGGASLRYFNRFHSIESVIPAYESLFASVISSRR
jgi:glycosyltransferase involved in cell wall biosynthesis